MLPAPGRIDIPIGAHHVVGGFGLALLAFWHVNRSQLHAAGYAVGGERGHVTASRTGQFEMADFYDGSKLVAARSALQRPYHPNHHPSP